VLPDGVRLEVEVPDGRLFQVLPAGDPVPPGAITEASQVFFYLSGGGLDVFAVDLSVDGVVLERVALSPTRVRWRWSIGFHAGCAELALSGVDATPIFFEVVTDPQTAKLTRSEFARMVADILTDTLSLISITGHRAGFAKGGRALEYARLEYLRRSFDRIEKAVLEVNRAPWLRLERGSRSVPLARALGVTPIELSKAARHSVSLAPGDVDRLSEVGRRLAMTLGGRLPRTVRRSTGQFDNRRREHADMLMVLLMWRRFLVRVGVHLGQVDRAEADAARIELQLRRVRQMGRRLERLMRLPLFEGITPSRGPVEPSQLFRRVQAYRRFYSAYREFLSGLSDIAGGFLNLPLNRTFDLYEVWCFLRLAHAAALYSGREAAWKESFVERAAYGGLVVRLERKPFQFGAFTLIFQPIYEEIWRTEGPRVGSFSRPMQPDMALSVTSEHLGEPHPVIVLDAKYRIDTGLNEAIGSIHTYRDALVEQVGAVPGVSHRRTVRAAFLLSPQSFDESDESGGSWRGDRAPAVFFREGYREAFRFGAVSMKPGMTIEQCRSVLVKLLDACEAGPG
jgi:hypothetical protein